MGAGKFVWHDLMTPDVDEAKRFYGELFGWTYEVWKPGEMDYPMISAAGRQWGGMMTPPPGRDVPSHWMSHVTVDDADATVRRAEKAGGSVHVPPREIPEVGRFAVIADPQEASIAAFQPAGEAPPSAGEPGPGAFVWHELLTSDVDGALAFYAELFGWTDAPMEMGPAGTYHILKTGDTDAGGLMAMPPGVEAPPFWLVYLAVEDVDASAAKAGGLGARTLMPAFDIPGIGREAILMDPAGAVFAVFTPAG